MRIAVVTGGNKGLGLAQTGKFVTEGFQVHVVARSRGDLSQFGEAVTFHEHDLANWSDTSWLERIHASAGQIDVLVNNAGMHLKKPAWEVAPDELGRVIDLNVKAMFTACGAYVRLCKASGGAIVNLSSMGGLMALPSSAAYVTSKTAVIGLTRAVAVDGAAHGIRCNAVCPGFIDTDMTRAILEKDPARRARIEGRIPGGIWGTPQNIADAVHFLATPASRYINGVALPVDGGYAVGF